MQHADSLLCSERDRRWGSPREVHRVVVEAPVVVTLPQSVRRGLTGSANESLNVTAAATKRTYVTAYILLSRLISCSKANRLRWYVYLLHKEDNNWMKKCMEYEVEGSRPRDRPERTWIELVQKDCQACKLNMETAMDRSRWRRLIGVSGYSP